MQKSCHDMDILTWLVGSKSKRIASFGDLTHFTPEHQPAHGSDRCVTCQAAEACRFDARKVYLPIIGQWPATQVATEQTEDAIMAALKTGPYGRCVYQSDNDVCDHQVTLIEFENGVKATFQLSCFTNRISRTIKIMCEHGEIHGDDLAQTITLIPFTSNGAASFDTTVMHIEALTGGHGGGDLGLVRDFIQRLQQGGGDSKSSINQSVESHMMAYAAEEARVHGQVVDMKTQYEALKPLIHTLLAERGNAYEAT